MHDTSYSTKTFNTVIVLSVIAFDGIKLPAALINYH